MATTHRLLAVASVPARSSDRAVACTAGLLVGFLAIAVAAGVPASPLTVLLPEGAHPPTWSRAVAAGVGLDGLDRPMQIAVAVGLVALVVALFAVVAAEAWAGRLPTRHAAVAAGVAIVIAVASPLLLSRDVHSYADAGRLAVVHRTNPYSVPLGAYPDDPFVAATSKQWLRHPTVYGPAWTLASEGLVRAGGSPRGTFLAFKLAAGVGVAVATASAGFAARALRPGRTAFAIAVVGLNPVVIVHTVGGGHVDAVIGGLLGAAALLAFARGRVGTVGALGATACLVLVCLVKVVLVPLLALWLWQRLRDRTGRSWAREAAAHGSLVVGLVLLVAAPFVDGWTELRRLAAVGGLEWWASPTHLVAHVAARLAGADAAGAANLTVVTAFLLAGAVVVVRVARRAPTAPSTWAAALLVLALVLPFVLPWYALWFLPLLALVDDEALVRVGVAASLLLGLTLVPADPFHGLTTPGVMVFVHDVVGPAMLLLLAFTLRRLWRTTPSAP